MTTSSLVTIGMPCYNAADTIVRALASAQGQTWPELEILVCDDASTDGSVELVTAAAARDPRIRLIRQEVNAGAGAARSRLVEEARGEYVCFFDDDDVSLPERVGTQIGRLETYERTTGARLVACYASGTTLHRNGARTPSAAIGSTAEVPHGSAVADYLLVNRRRPGWFYGAGVPTCALLARRSTMIEVGSFDPRQRRLQDIEFAIRLALHGGHFVGTPERLFIRHLTVGADKTRDIILRSRLALIETHRPYLDKLGRYDYARRWFLLRHEYEIGNHVRFGWGLIALFARYPAELIRHVMVSFPARLRRIVRKRRAARRAIP